MMKKIALFVFAALTIICCNPKKNDNSAEPATNEAQQEQVADDAFCVIDSMRSAKFLEFFKAEVDDEGQVTCQFMNTDDPEFCFDPDCEKGLIKLENVKGRCCGVAIMMVGHGVDPVLCLLMEDGNIEQAFVFEIGMGMRKCNYRTTQGGVVSLVNTEATDEAGADIEGYDANRNKIDLNWESTYEE